MTGPKTSNLFVSSCLVLLLLCVALCPEKGHGFTTPSARQRRHEERSITTGSRLRSELQLSPITEDPIDFLLASSAKVSSYSSSILVAEVEEWRQYVPLVVSCLVIVDILLGSPAANGVLGALNGQGGGAEDGGEAQQQQQQGSLLDIFSKNQSEDDALLQKRKERVDTTQVANDALDRARNALEWNQDKDKYKSDMQKMEDIRRQMDQQLQNFDSNLEEQKLKLTEEELKLKSKNQSDE